MDEKTAYGELTKRVQQLKEIETQCQAVEEALQESEAKYHSLLDLIPDSVVILQDGHYQFISSVFSRQFGYTREDINVGLSFARLVQVKDREAARRRYKDRLAGKPLPKTFRIDLTAKDGRSIPCETSATLIHYKGRPADLVVIRDISERIAAEKELLRAREELEKKVEARTAELTRINATLKSEIGKRKNTEKILRERETELEIKAANLEEVNTALKVLLRRREADKKELEESLLLNVKEMVEPYLRKLKRTYLNDQQGTLINIVESNLNDIITPFVCRVSVNFLKFTPAEIHITNLIKQGRPTKGIAKILNLSPRTVEFHRDNIRKKFGIKNRKINLRTHLLTIQQYE